MKLSTKPYKGTRDFYPEDMRLRNWMFEIMRKACESYGYEEYSAPVLEPLDLYLSKTSEEVVNEQSYSFTDRGDRKVIMRPEMTPSVSRMVADRRQELGYPLRLYSIANFFRYERPQKGRLREFWQLNADIFGVASVDADMEIIQLADSVMKAFGAKPGSYEIRINSRKLLNKRIEEAGIKTSLTEVIRTIDAFEKLSEADFKAKIVSQVDNPQQLFDFLTSDGDSEEVKKIITDCEKAGVKIKSSPALARGFDYYTDIVFEIFDTSPDNNRSLFGGGRYDGLISNFGVDPLPTVGFGMGDVTLENFLRTNNLIPESVSKPVTDLVIVGISVESIKMSQIAEELRKEGINVAVDYTDRKIDKKIKTVEKIGVENILFVGEEELKTQKFSLKNIRTGVEQNLSIEQIGKNIRNF